MNNNTFLFNRVFAEDTQAAELNLNYLKRKKKVKVYKPIITRKQAYAEMIWERMQKENFRKAS